MLLGICLATGAAAYWVAKKYLIYGFESNYLLPLSLFVSVSMSAVGLLLMLVA